MSKKHTIKKTAAVLLGLMLTVGATGCDFIVTDNEKDLAQVVADVDITSILKGDTDFSAYEEAVKTIIENAEGLSTVYKRDLVASFLRVGYEYMNTSGMSYKETFELLMDGLVNRKILTQYAIAYYAKKADNQSGEKTFDDYRTEQRQDTKTAAIDDKHPEILRLKYYLTNFGQTDDESMKEYNVAVYTLKKSLNDSLDSLETQVIKAETSDHSHSETRTMPKKVNAEKEDYYAVDYDIYTGRNAITVCGAYEKVDGSTPSTRKQAYNSFLANLQAYGLIGKDENTSDITGLEYYYEELSSTLAQALVNKYYEELNDVAVNGLTAAIATQKYNELFADQKDKYTKDESAFATALDGLKSDDKFVLYGQKGFGFVYNILLPFSTKQTLDYTMVKNAFGDDKEGIYNARKAILQEIEAEDLRTAWFCTEEDSNYSYAVQNGYWNNGNDKGEKTYLFFEKNNTTTSDRYESLGQYLGQYPYNGTATENEDGDYDFEPYSLDIDDFLTEMKAYIEYATKDTNVTVTYSENGAYGKNVMNTDYVNDAGETDWSKFVYATGNVNFTQAVNPADYFKAGTEAYKAVSAVNELMFAYSTDTGCLNTYMGNVVSPYKTDFVSEFEYAAQKVVLDAMAAGKPGTFAVAPSDYGWHIIYCSFYYDGGNDGKIYGDFNANDMETEGTLSYMFYEALKASTASNYTNEMQEILLEEYKDAATRYTKKYQNLLDMDN